MIKVKDNMSNKQEKLQKIIHEIITNNIQTITWILKCKWWCYDVDLHLWNVNVLVQSLVVCVCLERWQYNIHTYTYI